MKNFPRNISLDIYMKDPQTVKFTSHLKDNYHDFRITADIEPTTLVIKAIDVIFDLAPTENCPGIREPIQGLIGTAISKGLTKKVVELTSGSTGCINVKNMLLSGLPLVINFVTAQAYSSEAEALDGIHQRLKGTCIGYQ